MLDDKENKRVKELISYEIVELAPEPELDEITKLACIICETPLSFISLIDHTILWIKSKQGAECAKIPKEISMCQYTIQQQDLFVVPDLMLDDRYVLDPVELGGPGYRFYAGVPLVTPSGFNIGTLCVFDYKPRNLNENQKYVLKSMAKQIITNFELKKNNKELIKLNEKIQVYKGKEEFFSNMSHELRTPLNSLSGFTDLLSNTKLNKKQKEYLNILRSSIDYLISIINDVLDYSKIDSGNLKIESHTFNVRTLTKTIYELFKIKTQEKNLTFSVDVCKNVPSYINGDKTRLNQILVNLLGNAIKFTEKGSVSINIKTLTDSEKETTLSFSVKDTGIGIATEQIKDIFERFHQVEGTTRVFGGSGLGLSIVKSLVELQDGKITVKSELGNYSEFCVHITFQKSSQGEIYNLLKEGEINHIVSASDLKGIKILLAEDNLINVKLIQKIFEGKGIHLEISENGKVCIDKLKKNKFDIILMDIYMPVMDGYDTTRHIRNTMKLNTPIIALSANISEIYKKKCLELGMNDYVTKPFKIDELLRAVKKCYKKDIYNSRMKIISKANNKNTDVMVSNTVRSFKSKINSSSKCSFSTQPQRKQLFLKLDKPKLIIHHKSQLYPKIFLSNFSHDFLIENSQISSLSTKRDSRQSSQESFDKINMNILREYSGEDQDFQEDLLNAFIQEVPEYFKQLEFNISKENFVSIKKTAHKLKSPLGIFGLNLLMTKLEEIEQFCEKSQITPIRKLVKFCKQNLELITRGLKTQIEIFK